MIRLNYVSEPLIHPRDFRVDPTIHSHPHEAHFIWESVDPRDERIMGKFRGYKVGWRRSFLFVGFIIIVLFLYL